MNSIKCNFCNDIISDQLEGVDIYQLVNITTKQFVDMHMCDNCFNKRFSKRFKE